MTFTRIIDDLFSPDTDSARLRTAANEYYKFLSRINGIGDSSQNNEDDIETILSNGKAISPKDAARCVLDYKRTSRFLCGIYAAILEAKKRFPNEKIEILYAGCGPFAALAVPFCLKFSADEICFSLIDIHKRSLDSAAKIFQKLEADNFINEYIQTDATVFRAANDKKFHIIITETMQKTLEKEPQAAITLNLAEQLHENGIFIPQKITIEACLAKLQKEFDSNTRKERIFLGDIFELSAENPIDKNALFSPKILEISSDIFDPMSLILLTKIEIFDSIKLENYNSGITYPTILRDFTNIKAGQKIEFQYVTGENPHFEHRLI